MTIIVGVREVLHYGNLYVDAGLGTGRARKPAEEREKRGGNWKKPIFGNFTRFQLSRARAWNSDKSRVRASFLLRSMHRAMCAVYVGKLICSRKSSGLGASDGIVNFDVQILIVFLLAEQIISRGLLA